MQKPKGIEKFYEKNIKQGIILLQSMAWNWVLLSK